ncbi:MAG TPA: FUSC family protein [Gammaproteobacteria bacterium]|nr:FUSC family protein [Gammaproteobacteria bacterium]
MHFNQIKQEIKWNSLILGILSLVPILIGYLWFHEPLLFNVGLVTISLFVPIARNHTGLYLALLQFVLIWLCFTLLFFTFQIPYLFAFFTAAIAFGVIYFTRYDSNLRSLANFIFIPAVYLSCELHESLQHTAITHVYRQFVLLMPIALLTNMVLVIVMHALADSKLSNDPSGLEFKSLTQRILHGEAWGKIEENWVKQAAAIFFGILIAASIVIYKPIPHGEWVIWSTAAVITADLSSSKKKIQDRLIGLFIGVPLGFFVGQFLPKNIVTYSIAVLAVMMSLVTFKTYRVAFTCRCFFIALASYLATATPQIALERVENVILGGIIGMASLYIADNIAGNFSKRKTQRSKKT